MRAEGHANVIRHAIKILENDGFANFATLAKESEGFLTQGALHADDDGREFFVDIDLSVIFCVDVDMTRVSVGFKTGSLEHYHCPETNCGLDLHAYSSMEDLANFIVCRGIVGGLTVPFDQSSRRSSERSSTNSSAVDRACIVSDGPCG